MHSWLFTIGCLLRLLAPVRAAITTVGCSSFAPPTSGQIVAPIINVSVYYAGLATTLSIESQFDFPSLDPSNDLQYTFLANDTIYSITKGGEYEFVCNSSDRAMFLIVNITNRTSDAPQHLNISMRQPIEMVVVDQLSEITALTISLSWSGGWQQQSTDAAIAMSPFIWFLPQQANSSSQLDEIIVMVNSTVSMSCPTGGGGCRTLFRSWHAFPDGSNESCTRVAGRVVILFAAGATLNVTNISQPLFDMSCLPTADRRYCGCPKSVRVTAAALTIAAVMLPGASLVSVSATTDLTMSMDHTDISASRGVVLPVESHPIEWPHDVALVEILTSSPMLVDSAQVRIVVINCVIRLRDASTYVALRVESGIASSVFSLPSNKMSCTFSNSFLLLSDRSVGAVAVTLRNLSSRVNATLPTSLTSMGDVLIRFDEGTTVSATNSALLTLSEQTVAVNVSTVTIVLVNSSMHFRLDSSTIPTTIAPTNMSLINTTAYIMQLNRFLGDNISTTAFRLGRKVKYFSLVLSTSRVVLADWSFVVVWRASVLSSFAVVAELGSISVSALWLKCAFVAFCQANAFNTTLIVSGANVTLATDMMYFPQQSATAFFSLTDGSSARNTSIAVRGGTRFVLAVSRRAAGSYCCLVGSDLSQLHTTSLVFLKSTIEVSVAALVVALKSEDISNVSVSFDDIMATFLGATVLFFKQLAAVAITIVFRGGSQIVFQSGGIIWYPEKFSVSGMRIVIEGHTSVRLLLCSSRLVASNSGNTIVNLELLVEDSILSFDPIVVDPNATEPVSAVLVLACPIDKVIVSISRSTLMLSRSWMSTATLLFVGGTSTDPQMVSNVLVTTVDTAIQCFNGSNGLLLVGATTMMKNVSIGLRNSSVHLESIPFQRYYYSPETFQAAMQQGILSLAPSLALVALPSAATGGDFALRINFEKCNITVDGPPLTVVSSHIPQDAMRGLSRSNIVTVSLPAVVPGSSPDIAINITRTNINLQGQSCGLFYSESTGSTPSSVLVLIDDGSSVVVTLGESGGTVAFVHSTFLASLTVRVASSTINVRCLEFSANCYFVLEEGKQTALTLWVSNRSLVTIVSVDVATSRNSSLGGGTKALLSSTGALSIAVDITDCDQVVIAGTASVLVAYACSTPSCDARIAFVNVTSLSLLNGGTLALFNACDNTSVMLVAVTHVNTSLLSINGEGSTVTRWTDCVCLRRAALTYVKVIGVIDSGASLVTVISSPQLIGDPPSIDISVKNCEFNCSAPMAALLALYDNSTLSTSEKQTLVNFSVWHSVIQLSTLTMAPESGSMLCFRLLGNQSTSLLWLVTLNLTSVTIHRDGQRNGTVGWAARLPLNGIALTLAVTLRVVVFHTVLPLWVPLTPSRLVPASNYFRDIVRPFTIEVNCNETVNVSAVQMPSVTVKMPFVGSCTDTALVMTHSTSHHSDALTKVSVGLMPGDFAVTQRTLTVVGDNASCVVQGNPDATLKRFEWCNISTTSGQQLSSTRSQDASSQATVKSQPASTAALKSPTSSTEHTSSISYYGAIQSKSTVMSTSLSRLIGASSTAMLPSASHSGESSPSFMHPSTSVSMSASASQAVQEGTLVQSTLESLATSVVAYGAAALPSFLSSSGGGATESVALLLILGTSCQHSTARESLSITSIPWWLLLALLCSAAGAHMLITSATFFLLSKPTSAVRFPSFTLSLSLAVLPLIVRNGLGTAEIAATVVPLVGLVIVSVGTTWLFHTVIGNVVQKAPVTERALLPPWNDAPPESEGKVNGLDFVLYDRRVEERILDEWTPKAFFPAGQWQPLETRLTFGALFATMKGKEKARWRLLEAFVGLAGGVITGAAQQLGATNQTTECNALMYLMGLLHGACGVLLAGVSPYRLPTDTVLTPVSHFLISALCILRASMSGGDTVQTIMSTAQCAVAIIRSLLSLWMGWRESVVCPSDNNAVRLSMPLSCSAQSLGLQAAVTGGTQVVATKGTIAACVLPTTVADAFVGLTHQRRANLRQLIKKICNHDDVTWKM